MTATIDLSGDPMRSTVSLSICGVKIGEVLIDRNANFTAETSLLRLRVEQAMHEHYIKCQERVMDIVVKAMGGVP